MKICYFGIYRSDFGRNKVYMSGLRKNGVEIVECQDESKGLVKYWRLWKKHRQISKSGGCDAMIVGYPGHMIVPFAKLLSEKPVVFDALCTLYEGEIISRGKYRFNLLMRAWIAFIDRLAVKCADLTMVESDAQKEFFLKRFSLNPDKVVRIFTGADEEVYHSDPTVAKLSEFTAVFRGRFLPEAGVIHIIKAAKLLEKHDINVRIIGAGQTEREVASLVNSLKPNNLEWIRGYFPSDQLRKLMLECHISLGQFDKHGRLNRTIPHKAFESLSMGLPYVTGRASGTSELLTDGKDCLMVNLADPEDLADKIVSIRDDPKLRRSLADNGRELYRRSLSPTRLAKEIIANISNLL